MKLFKSPSEKLRDLAYKQKVNELSLRRRTVYNIIQTYGKLSGEMIAEKMKLRLNEVSGRITELSNMRLIKHVGETHSTRSKLLNTVWSITTPTEREHIIKTDLIYFRAQVEDLKIDLDNVVTDWAENLIRKEIKRLERRLKLIQ